MPRRRAGRWGSIGVVVMVFALAACSGGDDASPSTAGAAEVTVGQPPVSADASATAAPTPAPTTSLATDAAEVAAASASIAAADLADAETVAAVETIRLTDAGVQAAAEALAAGVSGDALWAATWIYTTGGIDPAPLRPLLDADDPTVRAMAAAALLARGVIDGAQPLAGLASSDQPVRGATPPISIGEFAAGSLARFVSAAEIAPGATPADTAAAWSAWLAEHASTMTFDEGTGRWVAS